MNTNSEIPENLDRTRPFSLGLFNGIKQIGWLGATTEDYGIVTDARNALILYEFIYDNKTYYYFESETLGPRFMTVANELLSYRVQFGIWQEASSFSKRGDLLISDYCKKSLSFSGPRVYAFEGASFTQLFVKFHRKPVVVDPPLTANIEHVVVVMMENRSFDNVLGGLYPEKSRTGEYRGLTGSENIPLDPHNPSKGNVQVFQSPSSDATNILPFPDPGEDFVDMNNQLFAKEDPICSETPTMNGFAWDYGKQPAAPLEKNGMAVFPDPKNIMHYFGGDSVPISWYLASQFAVCDNWFAAAPVQTLCNRVMTHCGTPGIKPGTTEARINNPDFMPSVSKTPPFIKPTVNEPTIFQRLDEAYPGQVNWKVYYHDAPLSVVCDYVYNNWDWVSYNGGNVFNFKETDSAETNLEYDIKNGTLPKYSFIEPRYTDNLSVDSGKVNSSHPGGAGINFEHPNDASLPPAVSVSDGEGLLHQVYSILNKYQQTFEKTLLVVIYDEHGGLYDHIPPPRAKSPFNSGVVSNFDYCRYGVRIPAMLVNPSIAPGTIYPSREKIGSGFPFDHTSLISTICAQFGAVNNLTPRTVAAPMLTNLIPPIQRQYNRPNLPPSPAIQDLEPRTVLLDEPTFDLEKAMKVLDQQEQPHSLAKALVPIAYVAQQRYLKPKNDDCEEKPVDKKEKSWLMRLIDRIIKFLFGWLKKGK